MKLLRYADYKISFDFNFSQRQKHMYMYVFIKRTSRQLFIMHWLSRSGLQFSVVIMGFLPSGKWFSR